MYLASISKLGLGEGYKLTMRSHATKARIILISVLALTSGVAVLYSSLAVVGIVSFVGLALLSFFPAFIIPLLLIARSSAELVGDLPLKGLPISNIATTIASIAPILLLAVVIIKRFSIPKVILPFLLFFLAASSGILFSPNRVDYLIDFVRIFSMVAVMWVTMSCFTENNSKVFVASFFCGALVPVSMGGYQILFGKGLFQLGQFNRAYGSFRHPSDYGYFLLMFIIILVGIWAGYYKKKKSGIFCVVLTLLMVNMLLTFSRMVWMLFIFALAMYALLLSKQKRSRFVIFAVIFLSIIFGVIFMSEISSRFETEFIFSGHGGSGVILGIPVTGSPSSRIVFMEAAINEFLKRPLLGNGLGYFYYYLSPHLFEQKVEVHSDVVKLLCETGVVGTAIFLYALYALLAYMWKHYKVTQDAFVRALCLIGVVMICTKAVQLCLDAALRLADVEFYWWAAVGIILGYIKLDNLKCKEDMARAA